MLKSSKLSKLSFPKGQKEDDSKKKSEQPDEFSLEIEAGESELPEGEEFPEESAELADDSQGPSELSKFDDEELLAEIKKRGLDMSEKSEESEEQYI
jgi:hypothetical protein